MLHIVQNDTKQVTLRYALLVTNYKKTKEEWPIRISFDWFLQVPETGNYTFYLACDEECELWLQTPQAIHLTSHHEDDDAHVTSKELIASVKEGYVTKHREWER